MRIFVAGASGVIGARLVPPRIHVDDAARQSLPALTAPPGVTLVADDRAARNGRDLAMAITARELAYHDEETALTGVLAWDDAAREPLPGLLLVHGGAGLDDHAKGQARRYAEHGYVVLACDMFGDGVAGNRERVIACLTGLRDDPDRLVRRAQAGLTALAACAETDGRFAAVGFCFGGLTALTLARAGAALMGVVSMHGSLATVRPAAPGAVRARVLACHGALDPHVPMADVVSFAAEMDHARADWQLIMYGGAVHGFTHEHAVPGAIPGVAYDEAADRRSFQAARTFLAEALTAGAR